jgi:predicted aspartyl protease
MWLRSLVRRLRIKKMRIYSTGKEGFIYARAKVWNPDQPKLSETVSFLLDTGAYGCFIPEALAKKLGLKESGEAVLEVADGREITAKISYIFLELGGWKVHTWCAYREGFEPILGMNIMHGLKIHLDVPERQILLPPLRRIRVKSITLKTNLHLSDECWQRIMKGMEDQGAE